MLTKKIERGNVSMKSRYDKEKMIIIIIIKENEKDKYKHLNK